MKDILEIQLLFEAKEKLKYEYRRENDPQLKKHKLMSYARTAKAVKRVENDIRIQTQITLF